MDYYYSHMPSCLVFTTSLQGGSLLQFLKIGETEVQRGLRWASEDTYAGVEEPPLETEPCPFLLTCGFLGGPSPCSTQSGDREHRKPLVSRGNLR